MSWLSFIETGLIHDEDDAKKDDSQIIRDRLNSGKDPGRGHHPISSILKLITVAQRTLAIHCRKWTWEDFASSFLQAIDFLDNKTIDRNRCCCRGDPSDDSFIICWWCIIFLWPQENKPHQHRDIHWYLKMSWFSDNCGKGCKFLDRMDQTLPAALTNSVHEESF